MIANSKSAAIREARDKLRGSAWYAHEREHWQRECGHGDAQRQIDCEELPYRRFDHVRARIIAPALIYGAVGGASLAAGGGCGAGNGGAFGVIVAR